MGIAPKEALHKRFKVKSFLLERTGIYVLRSRGKHAASTRVRVRQEVIHEVKYLTNDYSSEVLLHVFTTKPLNK